MFDRQRDSREGSGEALSQHYRDTGVRQNFPGRISGGLRLLPAHYGKVGVGKSNGSMYECISRKGKRQWRRGLALTVFSLLSMCFAACGPSNDPQPEFERVEQLFLRGDLIHAQADSAKAYRYYSDRSPQWSWKFRILNARTLTWRGMYQDVLPVLSPELPPFL